MKKFYDKFFKVNDDEVISNSTFVANIVFSMFVMVICVAMMSMSAFAYFSYSLSSSHNTIVSASSDKIDSDNQMTVDFGNNIKQTITFSTTTSADVSVAKKKISSVPDHTNNGVIFYYEVEISSEKGTVDGINILFLVTVIKLPSGFAMFISVLMGVSGGAAVINRSFTQL